MMGKQAALTHNHQFTNANWVVLIGGSRGRTLLDMVGEGGHQDRTKSKRCKATFKLRATYVEYVFSLCQRLFGKVQFG